MRIPVIGSKERSGSSTSVEAIPTESDNQFHPSPELLSLVDSNRWSSREQFLGGLSEENRTNVLLIENFLQSLPSLAGKFRSGEANIFVVGTAALPTDLLNYINRTGKVTTFKEKGNSYKPIDVGLEQFPDRFHPRDIDLRVIVDSVDEETVASEIALEFPKSFLRGLFSKFDFPRDVAYDDILTKKRITFYPIGGSKRIDVLLPGEDEHHVDIEKFLELHVNNLRRLGKDLQEIPLCYSHEKDWEHAQHLITNSFAVRLV